MLSEQINWTADALLRAERLGDPVLLFSAAEMRHIAAVLSADIDEADRCLEIMGSLAERLDQPALEWALAFTRAGRALIAGDPEHAEKLATDALRIATDSGEPDAVLVFGIQYIGVCYQRGMMSEAVPLIEQAVVDNRGLPALGGTLAEAYVQGERNGDARRLLEEFAARAFDLPLDATWIGGMVLYAGVAIECRDAEHARPVFDQLVPWADQFAASGGATASGPVSLYLGGLASVLGRYDEAQTYFAQAAAMNAQMGATYFAARTDLLWGRMLAARQAPDDAERARDLLAKARSAAVANGYQDVARRAAEALDLLDN
jgi:tetratricopeptide (TPR) repeat protein